jgi:hypothetical protein
MPRYQLGSRFLWAKALALGLFLWFDWWSGFAHITAAKIILGAVVLILVLGLSVEPVGYANEDGIFYRKWIRGGRAQWQEVKRVEWIPNDMKLVVTLTGAALAFKYSGFAPLFGSRQRPEAVNFIEEKLRRLGFAERFICETSLAS